MVFMNIKNKKIYIIALFTAVLLFAALTGGVTAVKSFAAERTLVEIEAYYLDDAVEVGHSIDRENLVVTGYYVVNGTMTTAEIKDGYTVSPPVVSREGTNTMHVFYQGCTAKFTVEGKRIEFISAEYVGKDVTVGQQISKDSVKVTAYFSDGTETEITNFTVPVTLVMQEGMNTLRAVYGNKVAEFEVFGIPALAVEELVAFYTGEPVIVGNPIDKSKIDVQALYNDGTIKDVKNFLLTPSTVMREGENKVILSYGGATTEIFVEGLAREVVSITARYTGYGVQIGETVNKDDIEVIATYNDGTTEQITSFTMSGALITMEGDNIVLVYCDSFMEEITVIGYKAFTINYDNPMDTVIFGTFGDYSMVTLAMNEGVSRGSFFIGELMPSVVERVVQRAIPSEEFIAFTVTYDEDDMIKEFPMGMKVTVPEGYDPEQFGVYYTPNQKTILAKLNGKFLDETNTEYEFVICDPGTYIIVNAVSNLLVEEIVIAEEMNARVGRNYSLKPLVLPLNAENKEVSYWSSDEEIATVSENGNIKTYMEGTCDIWIEAKDGSGVRAIVTLNVK